jgi:hypothetical protein
MLAAARGDIARTAVHGHSFVGILANAGHEVGPRGLRGVAVGRVDEVRQGLLPPQPLGALGDPVERGQLDELGQAVAVEEHAYSPPW